MRHARVGLHAAMATVAALALLLPLVVRADAPSGAGRSVYEKWCAACHDPGINHPGTHALMAKYSGSKPAALVDRTDLPPDIVKYFVRHGITIMPPFRKTEISDSELDALAAYLSRNTK